MFLLEDISICGKKGSDHYIGLYGHPNVRQGGHEEKIGAEHGQLEAVSSMRSAGPSCR
jgi:hypothetical protein